MAPLKKGITGRLGIEIKPVKITKSDMIKKQLLRVKIPSSHVPGALRETTGQRWNGRRIVSSMIIVLLQENAQAG